MNRRDAHVLVEYQEDIPNYLAVEMLNQACADGVSRTIKGVFLTYDLNAGAGYEFWKPGHGQTLRFRVHDVVCTPSGLKCEVRGYTSYATHTVALAQIGGQHDGRQFSEHESVLTLDS